MTKENKTRMEIAEKAHAIMFGGRNTGIIFAVELIGYSYTGADTVVLVDMVMADIEEVGAK